MKVEKCESSTIELEVKLPSLTFGVDGSRRMRSSPVTQAGVKTQTIVRLIILLLTGGSLYCLDMNLREEHIEGKQHNQHQNESVKNITKQHKHIIWQSKFTK